MQLVVGRVGRPHGIRGEVTVQVHTDDPDLRFAAGSVLATDPASRGPLRIRSSRWHSGRLLIAFDGYADRSRAEELRGTLLVMDSAEAGPVGPEEFRDHELIGLDVVTVAGELVGVVADVLHHGQDVLVVGPARGRPGGRGPGRRSLSPVVSPGPAGDGPGQILVPFVAAIVPEVDVSAGRVVIDPPPGLLDLGSAGE
jgi:16S rRNA processing protein RimM